MSFSVEHKKSSKWSTFMGMKNITVNICEVFSGRGRSLFLELVGKEFKTCSNILRSCPYTVSRNYYNYSWQRLNVNVTGHFVVSQGAFYMRNCAIDFSLLPPFLEHGFYNLKLGLSTVTSKSKAEQSLLTLTINFTIKSKLNKRRGNTDRI